MSTLKLQPRWCLANMRVCRGEVHIWRGELDVEGDVLDGFQAVLSGDEQARAAAFHFARDQKRFIAGRGILRNVLGRYLHQHPRDVQFNYGPSGKPFLSSQHGNDHLRFNLTHADELLLVAVTRGKDIGVDVERVRADLEVESIAESFLSVDRFRDFETLPREEQVARFYALWTAQEAYMKARGDGLALGLRNLGVAFGWNGLEPVIRDDGSMWSLYMLEPERGFTGALVVRGLGHRVALWHWDSMKFANVLGASPEIGSSLRMVKPPLEVS